MDPASIYSDPKTVKAGPSSPEITIPKKDTPTQKAMSAVTKGFDAAGKVVGKIPGVSTISEELKTVANMGSIAARIAQGKLPTLDQSISILKTIPGMSTVKEVIEVGSKVKGIVDRTTAPADGKPHTCWLRSHGRGFGKLPSGLFSGRSCPSGKELDGGLCYDVCAAGSGVGPVCWGSCPAGTTACGVLCIADGEAKCIGTVTKVTKDTISTGIKSFGQDYFGAIMGALNVADDLAFPVCSTMNGISEQFEQANYWDRDEFEDDPHFYDSSFFLQ